MKSEEWDWTRTVVDHLDLHASHFIESVRFYEAVLAPLGIPKLYERDGSACFTHVNVVDAQPPTTNLHLCFYARSRAEVDAFHAAGVKAGFRSNGGPGYRDYSPGYYAAYLLDPGENNVEALYRTSGTPATLRTSGDIREHSRKRRCSPRRAVHAEVVAALVGSWTISSLIPSGS